MTLLLGSSVALAADVTLSPSDGADLNAVLSSLQPGDVVTFNPGVYDLTGTVYWTGVGTADAPITLKSAGGEVVLLNNGDYGGWVAQLEYASYVTIDGLTFAGPDFTTTSTYGYGGNDVRGLYIRDADHVTVRNCRIKSVGGTAMQLDGDTNNITISHNEMTGTYDGSGMWIGCGDASCYMQDSLIEFNLIHDVEGNGIVLNPGCQNVRIEHNVIFRADDTALVLTDTAFGPQNIVTGNAIWEIEDDGIYVEGAALIQNNLIFQVDGVGIYSRAPGYYDDELYDIQISHNTIAMTDDFAVRLENWFNGEDLVFANNALANPIGLGMFWDDVEVDPYGSSGYTSGNLPETENYISHNVVTGYIDGFDPILRSSFILPGGGITDFENYDNLDFYPTVDSMLRDQGDANGNAYIPVRDFNGTARDGASPDVGAYEYDGDGNPGWVVQEGTKTYTESEGRDSVGVPGGCCRSKADTTTAVAPAPFVLLAFLLRRKHRRA